MQVDAHQEEGVAVEDIDESSDNRSEERNKIHVADPQHSWGKTLMMMTTTTHDNMFNGSRSFSS